jgi:hypothetical protein
LQQFRDLPDHACQRQTTLRKHHAQIVGRRDLSLVVCLAKLSPLKVRFQPPVG